MTSEHTFCRRLLSSTMRDVSRVVPAADVKKAWAFRYTSVSGCSFHGPRDFYWYGRACCLWDARVKGWEAYLRKYHPEEA